MGKFKFYNRMNFIRFFIFLMLLFSLSCSPSYSKDIDMGMHFRDGDIRDFYFSISDYYRVPVRDVYVIRERYPFIIYEELPILFFIVREARVAPDLIVKYRRNGYSWFDIMIKFRLYPERVFERYIVTDGPPYGKAWGYHRKHQRRAIVYRDVDIIELSNIKFITDYYHEKPDVVVKAKKKHSRYIDVNREFYYKNKDKYYIKDKHRRF
ncbi:MAG: hypothetical protein N3A00_01620 [Thermodesulfovibrio sp.]|nr:hypothetical protein [Thermodesulfovibrio sp.]